MSGATCFICGETYYNDNETYIKVTRIERNGTTSKTTKWAGMVCDECVASMMAQAWEARCAMTSEIDTGYRCGACGEQFWSKNDTTVTVRRKEYADESVITTI